MAGWLSCGAQGLVATTTFSGKIGLEGNRDIDVSVLGGLETWARFRALIVGIVCLPGKFCRCPSPPSASAHPEGYTAVSHCPEVKVSHLVQ